MEPNWAAEHLQTIRTLMERSALYRRALAPIFTFIGTMGIVAAVVGWKLRLDTVSAFTTYWMAVCIVVIAGALLLVRRQALRQGEKFWSPPTRRIAQAVVPGLLAGLVFGVSLAKRFDGAGDLDDVACPLIVIWTILYGLALHAAGFFVSRGMRLFGWALVVSGLLSLVLFLANALTQISPHLLMGILFGLSHLACGIYLYFTEQRKNEA
jgi:hypothetical protein